MSTNLPIVKRLREMSQGRKMWIVQDKDDGSSCMHFEVWESREAKSWWEINREMQPVFHANNELALTTTLGESDRLMQQAADILEFLLSQLQMCSPDMGGNHSYRFRSSGWPMTHAKGRTAEAAILNAIKEIARSRSE